MRLEKKKKVTDKSESHKAGRGKRHSMDGHNSRRKKEEGGREGEREKQLSSCPSPHAARAPPWGESDFKPLPCFIFPWLLQPDQSSSLPGVTHPSSVLPGPQSSILGVVLDRMEVDGRHICKCTTGIPTIEADFKGLHH